MQKSVTDSTRIKALMKHALTDMIDDREVFMKGIDYSYYYEEDKSNQQWNYRLSNDVIKDYCLSMSIT